MQQETKVTTPTEKHGSIHIRANRNQKKKSAEKKSAKKRAKNEMHVCCVFELDLDTDKKPAGERRASGRRPETPSI